MIFYPVLCDAELLFILNSDGMEGRAESFEIIQVPQGAGLLFIMNSGGLVGKNWFQDLCVSPILVFTNSHPLIRENRSYIHYYSVISQISMNFLRNSLISSVKTSRNRLV